MEFDWDRANEEHLARHGVSRIEAEEALGDPLGEIVGAHVQDDELRYRYVGVTARGRLLVVAFTMRKETVRPITAFNADRPTAMNTGEENCNERNNTSTPVCD